MKFCPDCGEALTRINDTLYQCRITGLYYPCKYGKLGDPLTEPPTSMIETPPEQKQDKPSKQTTLPPNLRMELRDNIGEEQIANFLRFLKTELNMRPFEFMVQPKKLKNDVMARAFPHWLESKGLI
jgi:hypothetical protein